MVEEEALILEVIQDHLVGVELEQVLYSFMVIVLSLVELPKFLQMVVMVEMVKEDLLMEEVEVLVLEVLLLSNPQMSILQQQPYLHLVEQEELEMQQEVTVVKDDGESMD